jgi:cell division septum initiation protein DivIVA
MIDATSEMAPGITGADFANVTFAPAKGFSRAGYDPREVDAFLVDSADAVNRLNERLVHTEKRLQAAAVEIEQLRSRIDRDSRSHHVEQAVSVLTTAQITADNTVARADDYSARVMAEARDFADATRRDAAILEQETEKKAQAVYDDALRRVADFEHANEERLAQLTLSASIAQQELDGQTAYLRTLRDATRVQMEVFLEGLLDHLAEEYGRAHPMAAGAATGSAPTTDNNSPRTVATSDPHRRDQRHAGRSPAPTPQTPTATSDGNSPTPTLEASRPTASPLVPSQFDPASANGATRSPRPRSTE